MSKYRRAAKVDNNQAEIVKALRAIPNCTVALGHDDILVGYRGRNFWFELKQESAVSKKTGVVLDSAKKLTQIKLENEWEGHYRIVHSLDQILEDICVKNATP